MQNVTLELGDWWGSGIVHAKVWISDVKDIYIGSANNDWKSLTQVFQYFMQINIDICWNESWFAEKEEGRRRDVADTKRERLYYTYLFRT